MMTANNIIGNHYDKYSAQNPIARYLMDNFLASVSRLFNEFEVASFLEVGCGEGYLSDYLLTTSNRKIRTVSACDLSTDQVSPDVNPLINFEEASIYELPYDDASYDLVVCCEVLEHLDEPGKGLAELVRVSRNGILISTPWEPVWRFLNVLRGKYIRSLGNTPGHIQHFSRKDLISLAAKNFSIKAIEKPLPWTIISGNLK